MMTGEAALTESMSAIPWQWTVVSCYRFLGLLLLLGD
jgi:hypothetical protein